MKLGGSIRRRRGLKPGGEPKPRGPSDRPWFRLPKSKRALRLASLVLVSAIVGLGVGNLFSTRVMFPAPPPPGDLIPVPDLRGESLRQAEVLLAEVGLTVGLIDSIRHPEAREGEILGQSPLPGQLAPSGDTVRLAISLGPEERPVPDVMPLRVERATGVLTAAGFTVTVDSVESNLPPGRVVSMNPGPGTSVVLPTAVHLNVSLGPPMVEVPLLLGLDESEARALLTDTGLEIGEVSVRFRFGLDQGRVVEQDPSPGRMVRQGSAVRLVVGQRGG